ncbi:retrovirus-related pol polyprotein from transposon TNT 1-94 [Tanacetum coccineum]
MNSSLIGNLKVHEMIIKKDSEIVKAKGERKSLALKALKESSMKKVQLTKVKTKSTPCRLKTSRSSSREESDNGEKDDENSKYKTCLMAQASCKICLGIDLEPDEWIKDSGCSKHTTGNKNLFTTYKAYNGDNLRFNLLSVGQICDNKCKVIFFEHDSEITKDGKVIGRGLKKSGFPSAVQSYGGNLYTLVIVDDYSRTDHALRTPQLNGVVERKNRTLQEMSRTMLNEQSLPQKSWCYAVDTSTYILNRILIRAILGKTPFKLLRGRKPTLDYFKVFGSKCFILNTKDYLTKFDPKSYEGVFLGYSQNSKAHIILSKHIMKIEESNVTFNEALPPSKTLPLVDDDLDEEEAIKVRKEKLRK